jgi:hypothetical protein
VIRAVRPPLHVVADVCVFGANKAVHHSNKTIPSRRAELADENHYDRNDVPQY